MNPLVGRGLGGASFTARDEGRAEAQWGRPVWGPAALLRDLELRLGIPLAEAGAGVRVPCWAKRIESLGDERAFYAASFAADRLGTAERLLEWRDALIEAGWNGGPIADGGGRLDALTALEQHGSEALAPGAADRLRNVEGELALCRTRLYARLSLVEDVATWPWRWQTIFAQLEALGTAVELVQNDLPGAPEETDLGLLQRLLTTNTTLNAESPAHAIRGDGSLLVLRGETLLELGEFVAALLLHATDKQGVVVRSLDPGSLESALRRHGLAGQGHESSSPWRPAHQVLPLALELAFGPRNPHRLLELLTLPTGPFRGRLGAELAKAIARQPGVGGQEWQYRKQKAAQSLHASWLQSERDRGQSEEAAARLAAARVAEEMQRVEAWLEAPPAFGREIPRHHLLEVTRRVRGFLQSRLRTPGADGERYRSAHAEASAFEEALLNMVSDTLTREDTQQLFDRLARAPARHALWLEEAGRVAHVNHPSALLAACDDVVFWGFVAGAEQRAAPLPWYPLERRALQDAGVVLSDPGRLLLSEINGWRRAVLAARRRVVLVMPRSHQGTATAAHPLWDEIAARLRLSEDGSSLARVSQELSQVLASKGGNLATVRSLPPLALPVPSATWRVPAEALRTSTPRDASATAIQKLVGCPLSWVLEHRLDLRAGAVAQIAVGPLLNGQLSHRLVEELFKAGAFERDEATFLAQAEDTLNSLIANEGSTLLLEGAVFERAQLCKQVHRAMRELWRYLHDAGLRITAVEEPVEVASASGRLHGRLDLRLEDADGNAAVLDLKWGASSYRRLLERGEAIQLALYARALRPPGGDAVTPPGAFYALSSASVLTCDPRLRARKTMRGISLDETWSRLERTQSLIREALNRGVIQVGNTSEDPALLERLGVPDTARTLYYDAEKDAACGRCQFQAICGRAWRSFQ